MVGVLVLAASLIAAGQGTVADYERTIRLKTAIPEAILNAPGPATWITGTNHFWYRRTVRGGSEVVRVDADARTRGPAFDHEKLAAAFNAASGESVPALKLAQEMSAIAFLDKDKAIQFIAKNSRWRCSLAEFKCERTGPAPTGGNPPQLRITPTPTPNAPRLSPNGEWEAFVRNHNLVVRSKDKKQEITLSTEGSEGDYYDQSLIYWSPDSTKIAAYRVRPGYRRKIHFVESSPIEQLQPRYWQIDYAKPGDPVDVPTPVLFHVDTRQQFIVPNGLFPNPYQIRALTWRKDGRAFTFEYNQRGHQVYRVIEVDGRTGTPRTVVEETAKTFICYSSKGFRFDVADGKEVIWMSERDGWNHLYLLDEAGNVKNQITKGEWAVRGVERVDEANRQIYFVGNGMYPGKDPYFTNFYRINFDGTGLTRLTETDDNHNIWMSENFKYFVHSFSRADRPPVMQLRSAADGLVLMELEKADVSEAEKLGLRPAESFVAKGRDGKTDIWGNIYRPTNFDPKKKYPVIEFIYAGPHDSFVPKGFVGMNPARIIAELGFIAVQIDGMGTSNRSKAFHDVAWKNLGDAGFPDRILWHKAVASKYPYYDITRVGIFGASAGGQNAMGALLFHPEFYKVAVAHSGCHDNRMDKIWWNEQWMGWPIGPHYSAASNVDNAHKLRGKLMLTVGEMDPNVDPASTYQVVNALVKAGKNFDFIVFPGQGHGTGGAYGERRTMDFFVRHLLGVEPPDWNVTEPPKASADE
jgi:dipeptidyl aminopeptidase/acylaminoacyl peptidase